MDFEIRCARHSDISVIVELVYQLAIDEKKSPDQIGITAQKVEDYCFGERKCFDCDIVWVKENPIGYALYSFRFSGWAGKPVLYLEDLFVLPDFRRQSVGTSLLKHLASVAKENGCAFMEWYVFDWNKNAQAFYEQLGARIRKDFLVCRMDV